MDTSYKKIMVLDTETTGLSRFPKKIYDELESRGFTKKQIKEELKKTSYLKKLLEYKPYIIQLSYIICDLNDPQDPKIDKIFDTYIYLPIEKDSTATFIPIDKGATKAHGITNESLSSMDPSQKMTIEDAMTELIEDAETCDVIIGHNIEFDKQRILEELNRILIKLPTWDRYLSSKGRFLENSRKALTMDDKYYCTMKGTKEFCEIKGKRGFKNPKLQELYTKVFGYTPAELHNSLYDIIACLRAYIYITYGVDIYDKHPEIKEAIDHMFYSKCTPSCPTSSCLGDVCYKTDDINLEEDTFEEEPTCIGASCKFLGLGGKKRKSRIHSRKRSKRTRRKTIRKIYKNK